MRSLSKAAILPIVIFHPIQALALQRSMGIQASKMTNLPTSMLLKIVAEDITQRQALATADFTREIYTEDCTFTDQIDKYKKIDDYVKGTKSLFNGRASKVQLASTPKTSDDDSTISYRFNPKVDLTGRVEL